jgi:predicted extracellular nuclease
MSYTFSVAFYNLENLFDTENNEFTLDKDYTPKGDLEWTQDKYLRKIENLSYVISKIGTKKVKLPPILLGVAEVENKTCLEDLIHTEKLQAFDYDFIHYDSPDERGIDVAFLYQKQYFEVTNSETYTLFLSDEFNGRDYTRDVLLISGNLFGEPIYIIVNHWPSRYNGTKASNEKRVKAATLVQNVINDIYKENKSPNIIIMGDFNDEPKNESLKNHLITNDFYNLMNDLQGKNKGSVRYYGKWYLFDQIIINKALLNENSSKLIFKSAEIFNDHFLKETSNKRKGAPKRTFIGKWHQGGYSDHFPVLAYFKTTN